MHHPRKRFGQNFLKDQAVLQKILAAAELEKNESVLEIGPGLGALTKCLLAKGAKVTAIEIDRDLGQRLTEWSSPNLNIIVADVLKIDWAKILHAPPYKLIANLPYNISSQVLFKVLEHKNTFNRLVLMLQKEVGERLVSRPGSKNYGVLTVLIGPWFNVSKIMHVPPSAFLPRPKVDSVVLQFDRVDKPRLKIIDENVFRRLVKGAFAQRRKTLRNSLLGAGYKAIQIDRACKMAGIEPGHRGETLSVEEFGHLANRIAELTEGESHV